MSNSLETKLKPYTSNVKRQQEIKKGGLVIDDTELYRKDYDNKNFQNKIKNKPSSGFTFEKKEKQQQQQKSNKKGNKGSESVQGFFSNLLLGKGGNNNSGEKETIEKNNNKEIEREKDLDIDIDKDMNKTSDATKLGYEEDPKYSSLSSSAFAKTTTTTTNNSTTNKSTKNAFESLLDLGNKSFSSFIPSSLKPSSSSSTKSNANASISKKRKRDWENDDDDNLQLSSSSSEEDSDDSEEGSDDSSDSSEDEGSSDSSISGGGGGGNGNNSKERNNLYRNEKLSQSRKRRKKYGRYFTSEYNAEYENRASVIAEKQLWINDIINSEIKFGLHPIKPFNTTDTLFQIRQEALRLQQEGRKQQKINRLTSMITSSANKVSEYHKFFPLLNKLELKEWGTVIQCQKTEIRNTIEEIHDEEGDLPYVSPFWWLAGILIGSAITCHQEQKLIKFASGESSSSSSNTYSGNENLNNNNNNNNQHSSSSSQRGNGNGNGREQQQSQIFGGFKLPSFLGFNNNRTSTTTTNEEAINLAGVNALNQRRIPLQEKPKQSIIPPPNTSTLFPNNNETNIDMEDEINLRKLKDVATNSSIAHHFVNPSKQVIPALPQSVIDEGMNNINTKLNLQVTRGLTNELNNNNNNNNNGITTPLLLPPPQLNNIPIVEEPIMIEPIVYPS